MLLFLVPLQLSTVKAQECDSSATVKYRNKKTMLKKFGIPTALIGLGIYGTTETVSLIMMK